VNSPSTFQIKNTKTQSNISSNYRMESPSTNKTCFGGCDLRDSKEKINKNESFYLKSMWIFRLRFKDNECLGLGSRCTIEILMEFIFCNIKICWIQKSCQILKMVISGINMVFWLNQNNWCISKINFLLVKFFYEILGWREERKLKKEAFRKEKE
jgi:hypothetical protein